MTKGVTLSVQLQNPSQSRSAFNCIFWSLLKKSSSPSKIFVHPACLRPDERCSSALCLWCGRWSPVCEISFDSLWIFLPTTGKKKDQTKKEREKKVLIEWSDGLARALTENKTLFELQLSDQFVSQKPKLSQFSRLANIFPTFSLYSILH